MNDMMHLSDNISGFSVCRPCSPSEGVQKTQENARLRKVGKVRWTGKCGDRRLSWRCCIYQNAHLRKVGMVRRTEKCGERRLSWRCCICPPSEGGQKTRKNAHLRKVGKVRWTGKCGERQFSWQCCICPPSEGVRKTRETAHLRKVEQKVGRKRWKQGRGLAVIVGALLLCIGYFQAGAVSVQALEKYGMRQSEVISGVVVEAGSGTPVAGAVVMCRQGRRVRSMR